MIIYVVTRSDYEDTAVVAVFDSEEQANHLAEQDCDMEVQRFELNGAGGNGLIPWYVEMSKDGHARISLGSVDFAEREHDDFVVFIGEPHATHAYLRCTVLARDKNEAGQIVEGFRAQLQDRWPEAVYDGVYMSLPGRKQTMPAWEDDQRRAKRD